MHNLYVNPKSSHTELPAPEFSSSSEEDEGEDQNQEDYEAPVRRRSERFQKPGNYRNKIQNSIPKLAQLSKKMVPELSPASSISDTSPEEDVAYCLMMLSRDKWVQDNQDSGKDSDDEIHKVKRIKTRPKYRCETCKRVFASYQALGGHRASHKKVKVKVNHHDEGEEIKKNIIVEKKIHKCPVCFRVFASGQALGGHKRSHVTPSSSTMAMVIATPVIAKQSITMIDLNLPAPDEDDDEISQFDVSVVSDGEYVKPH